MGDERGALRNITAARAKSIQNRAEHAQYGGQKKL